jgi:hypothetical protein
MRFVMPTTAALRLQIETALAHRIPSALTPQQRIIRPVAPTGVREVDELLEGGLPVGAITEMVGPESSGRTGVALSFLSHLTHAGRVCAWVDVSDALSPESAGAVGVHLARLLWVRCGVSRAIAKPAAEYKFALPEKYLVAAAAKKGLHGGGCGGHPRKEVNGFADAMSGLLRPEAIAPRCAEPQRRIREEREWEWHGKTDTMAHSFHHAGFDIRQPAIAKYLELSMRIQDLPRHLGQHSGGMVICQGQLNQVVPLERASMPGRTVVQWDKEDCADLGIIKVDLLGLGMMAVLKDCLELIPKHYGDRIDMAQLPEDDMAFDTAQQPEVMGLFRKQTSSESTENRIDLAHLPQDDEIYRTLQQADTVGMFQVESRAQMASLPRNYPEKFYDLVVQVAIIRPGPIVGQMMHPYMRRRQGKEEVTYPHPSLEPVLKRTLGVRSPLRKGMTIH